MYVLTSEEFDRRMSELRNLDIAENYLATATYQRYLPMLQAAHQTCQSVLDRLSAELLDDLGRFALSLDSYRATIPNDRVGEASKTLYALIGELHVKQTPTWLRISRLNSARDVYDNLSNGVLSEIENYEGEE